MKKKNVLALALAAGLVFGGTAYADGEAEQAPAPAPAQTEELQENKEVVPQPVGAPAPKDESTDKQEPVEENNDNGFESEANAAAAAQNSINDINPYYRVTKGTNGRYYYELLAKPYEEPKPEERVNPPKLAEDKFNPDQGYATFEEAQKAAEAIIAKSDINKGYNITKGKDGKYYIELTVDAKKTKDLDRKEIKPEVKPQVKANNNNVQTGVAGLTGVVATLAAASTALFKSKRK